MTQTAIKLNESAIQNTLLDLGIPASLLGFKYLTKAIALVCEDSEYERNVTKMLYPEVAKIEHSTSPRVERAIRHAIEVAWDRGDEETLKAMFGKTISASKGKPTNSEFISTLALRLKQVAASQEQPKVQHGKWIYWDGWLGNHDQRIDDAKCSECGYRHPTVRREKGEHYGSTINKLARQCPCCKAEMDV